ncbi:MAG: hypothetical protein AB1765_05585 [Candidatus Hydrogenedentota bacterium]
MNDYYNLFGSLYSDLIVFFIVVIIGVSTGYLLYKRQVTKEFETHKKKNKICPLCRRELDDTDELYGKLKADAIDKVIILGCKYCYKAK